MLSPRPRLRVPEQDVLDEADRLSALPAGADVLRATLKLIAPAILGGFDANEADLVAPIRSKAVRGHLRHWWRLLAAAGAFAEWGVEGGLSDADASRLRELEFIAWGELPPSTDGVQGTPATQPPSQIGVDVQILGKPMHENAKGVLRRCPNLALGLYFATVNDRQVLMPRLAFKLVLTIRPGGVPDLAAMLARTVVCWAALGGIGGRTSRGMGAVQLEAFTLARSDGSTQHLELRPGSPIDAPASGQIDIFGVAKGILVDPGFEPTPDAACCALGWGLQQAMGFLQVPQGRPGGRGLRPGMSRWPEARLVRHLTEKHFRDPKNPAHHHDPISKPERLPGGTPPAHVAPRIAFGHRMLRFVRLQTQPPHGDPGQHAIVPAGSDRLPSGVLIRPMLLAGGPGRYGCLVVQRTDLAGDRLPAARLREGQNERNEPLLAWSPTWQAGQTGGCAGIAPLELAVAGSGIFNPAKDAGQAFINLLHAQFGGPVGGQVVP